MDTHNTIAVVGMGGVFPGASTLGHYWENIVSKHDSIHSIPDTQWPSQALCTPVGGADTAYHKHAGTLPAPWNESAKDDDQTKDRSSRLAIAIAEQAIKNCDFDRKRCGVILATIALPTAESVQFSAAALNSDDATAPLNANATDVIGRPAAEIADALGLGGPHFTIDAACASSLVAIKLACDDLRHNRIDSVIAGGLSCADSLYTQIGFTQLGALSPSGKCAPFSRHADGLVVGQGGGVLLLKRLEDALAAGDTIHAIVRGAGTSNDIGGNLLAPDSEGQLRAMKQAYAQAALTPRDIQYIECHGTGTPRGDRTELSSIAALWQQHHNDSDATGDNTAIHFGSVKSQIGHLLTGAGAASAIKVILALQEKTLPPQCNGEEAIEDSPLAKTPYTLCTEASPWGVSRGQRRRAAVSGFGFGGVNAHLIFEEWRPATPAIAQEIAPPSKQKKPLIAIVGIETVVGSLKDKEAFLAANLQSSPSVFNESRVNDRWGSADHPLFQKLKKTVPLHNFVTGLDIEVGAFPIPPNEIDTVMMQQLLMLKTASGALADAGYDKTDHTWDQTRFGANFAIDFDMEACNFHQRWQGDKNWPALTASRTVGALGGMVASRIAKAFRLGGPCLTLASTDDSGLHALERACQLLQNHECDSMLVGAVCLQGDMRQLLAATQKRQFSNRKSTAPFDIDRNGNIPSEGAVALVLKRYSDAVADGSTIYACIDENTEHQAQVADIISGDSADDRAIAASLRETPNTCTMALTATQASVGHCGNAASLLAVAKLALCMKNAVLPPMSAMQRGLDDSWKNSAVHVAREAQFWVPHRDGRRTATVLGSRPLKLTRPHLNDTIEHKHQPYALFVAAAATPVALLEHLQTFEKTLDTCINNPRSRIVRSGDGRIRLSFVCKNQADARVRIGKLRRHLEQNPDQPLRRSRGFYYSPLPLGFAKLALVYPGSGNFALGSQRELALAWPKHAQAMLAQTPELADVLDPQQTMPWRQNWHHGWQKEAQQKLMQKPLTLMIDQIAFGILATDILNTYTVRPDAIIGYSLGEISGLFANGLWQKRDALFHRMQGSNLFTEQLAGNCHAVRQQWGISENADFKWQMAVINCPEETVRQKLNQHPRVRMQIVNTHDECVIGGEAHAVASFIKDCNADAIPIDGVIATHCDVLKPVKKDYHDLHVMPTHANPLIDVYSCAAGGKIPCESIAIADSITASAEFGFRFPDTIEKSFDDGIRYFIEVGPGASCTRMINKIINGRQAVRLAMNVRGESEVAGILHVLGALYCEHYPVDISSFFRQEAQQERPQHHVKLQTVGKKEIPQTPPRAFDYDACYAFAVGKSADVLGPQFAVVDTYPVRVRLPDEPLMLCHRILAITGEPLSMQGGSMITEHDVKPQAWYLDHGIAPVSITVEAGQADLFLCAWLGIDFKVQGKRSYRLLDATIAFHRNMPSVGETIRFHIHIDRFIRAGETWLFFFHYEGFIGDEKLITMTDGCAGFFTPEEVAASGGTTPGQYVNTDKTAGAWENPWPLLVPDPVSLDDQAVSALIDGDLQTAFGAEEAFKSNGPRLPSGRMALVNRVSVLEQRGGYFGLGMIIGEADIQPDAWFLTCHFVDDKVMPGTLMYECCAITLRIFLMRMGWIGDDHAISYHPQLETPCQLSCRGPVTTETQKVTYRLDIKKIITSPHLAVIADAEMAADGRPIVAFTDMSIRIEGLAPSTLYPSPAQSNAPIEKDENTSIATLGVQRHFDYKQILAYSLGNPSEAFGERYRPYDNQRRLARLPGPPYLFVSRVSSITPEPWDLKPGGWIEAEYDIPEDAWYFAADRQDVMPFGILVEIALQPCGWLAAYLGSALTHPDSDLKFRNLDGEATCHRPITRADHHLVMRCRLTDVSDAGGMIIESFDMEVYSTDVQGQRQRCYTGTTTFGFFSAAALAKQVGVRGAKAFVTDKAQKEYAFDVPESYHRNKTGKTASAYFPAAIAIDRMPTRQLNMLDSITCYQPDGGDAGLGFIRAIKWVHPEEWFFQAHFYQDPVMPGSLGLEAFIQCLKWIALDRWSLPNCTFTSNQQQHRWSYRGQVVPSNTCITVEAIVTACDPDTHTLTADGFLSTDGVIIYHMRDFTLTCTPPRETV